MEARYRELENITGLLQAWHRGDRQAGEELMRRVEYELKWIAHNYLRKERRNHTLQPSALVNEAYLQLIGQKADWQNREHFFAVASTCMRRILIDRAKARICAKRGGKDEDLPLEEASLVSEKEEKEMTELIALDEALTRLEKLNDSQAKIIELHYFCGLTVKEITKILKLTAETVKSRLRAAKAWLYKELTKGNKDKNPKGAPGR
jgi:RNA polymerase sigma-70 factor (ECF subfamily)